MVSAPPWKRSWGLRFIVRHEITLRGAAFGLRPVERGDAEFIVSVRSDPRLGRFINPISPHVSDQERWLDRYYAIPDDYYFIVERCATGRPEGTVGLYHVDREQRRGEWGRWVLCPGSLAAAESALLIYRVAFDVLRLEVVYCRTITANQRVVSFHTSCGLITHTHLTKFLTVGAVVYDAVEQRLTRPQWPNCEAVLTRGANAAARVLSRQR